MTDDVIEEVRCGWLLLLYPVTSPVPYNRSLVALIAHVFLKGFSDEKKLIYQTGLPN